MIQLESWENFSRDAKELWAEQTQALAELRGYDVPLDVNHVGYLAMEKLGLLRVMTVRHGEELAGYAIALVTPHLHHNSTICGVVDTVFVAPRARKGLTGYKLFRAMVEELKRAGCKWLAWTVPTGMHYDTLLRRLGFELADRRYTLWLGDK